MKYAVSSCLMGVNCKYSGGNNANQRLIAYLKDHEVFLICPEVLGGLPIPRASAEIVEGRVKNTDQEDVTDQFLAGAKLALDQILAFQPDQVITQSRSPSCGKGFIYSGNFDKKLIPGNGKFVQMLLANDIPVLDIQEFMETIS